MSIEINSGLSLASNSLVGRVALVVEDDDQRRYALTARHIVDGFGDELIASQHSAGFLRRVDVPLDNHAEEPISAAIGRLELGPDVVASNRTVLKTVELAPDPCVGDPVSRLLPNGEKQFGRIEAIGGLVRIKSRQTGLSATFTGGFRIKFNGEGEYLEEGAGGSLILNGQDRALAIIITGRRVSCYAAPLEPYLRKYGLEPCALIDADRTRRTITDLFDDLKEFRRIMVGADIKSPSLPEFPAHLSQLDRTVQDVRI